MAENQGFQPFSKKIFSLFLILAHFLLLYRAERKNKKELPEAGKEKQGLRKREILFYPKSLENQGKQKVFRYSLRKKIRKILQNAGGFYPDTKEKRGKKGSFSQEIQMSFQK